MKQTPQEKYLARRAKKIRAEEEETKRVEKWMRAALRQARLGEKKGEVPIGAVVVLDGRIVSRAYNRRETLRLATAHAEILAIEKACRKIGDWRLSGAEIYVTLEPCTMCAGAIANARVSSLYFGAYERKGGACGSVRNVFEPSGLNSNTTIRGGVLEEECSALLSGFFEKKRNKISVSR